MLSTSVRGLCFRLMFRLQGHSKPKEFLNKPLIKKKKKKKEKKGKAWRRKKGPGICRNQGRCMKLNLKPGQGVIVGLHECIFAHRKKR